MMTTIASRLFILLGSLGLGACGKDDSKTLKASSSLSVSLQLVEAQNLAARSPSVPLLPPAVDPDTIDFTRAENNPNRIPIEALKVSLVHESYFASIGSITTKSDLEFDEGKEVYSSEEVYSFKGNSTQDCLVELSNPAAVKELLKDKTLKIERELNPEEPNKVLTTVRSLSVSGCLPGGRTTLYKLKAKADYFGYTWYTTSNGKVLTTKEEDYDYVSFESQGCSSAPWVLPQKIELRNGDSIKVNLLVNLTDVVQFSLYKNPNAAGDVIAGINREIVLSYPSPAPYIGETKEPTVEVYRLVSRDTQHEPSYNTDMNATLVMFIDPSSNEPLGATCRIHNDGIKLGWAHCPNPWSVGITGDGTYTFTGIQRDAGTAVNGPSVEVEFTKGFKRSNHTGAFETLDYEFPGRRQTWDYTATRL
jgi:hypothetical protein